MLQTTEHAVALSLMDKARHDFSIISNDLEGKKAGAAGLSFLEYLQSTWMPVELWQSWSRRGREDAAAKMGTAIEAILPTTNHLESFNGTLKKRDIPQWQHSGHRLRFDVLIYHLVMSILPRVYGRQRMISQYEDWKNQRFLTAAGGSLPDSPRKKQIVEPSSEHLSFVPRAWYGPDRRRDEDAEAIFRLGYLQPIPSARPYELWATCASSNLLSIASGESRHVYWLSVHPSGSATCTCMDFLTRGGACKHLRAFRLLIIKWLEQKELAIAYHFPTTITDAELTERQNHLWYGSHYERCVTQPCGRSGVPNTGEQLPAHMQTGPPTPELLHPHELVILPPVSHADDCASLEQEVELQALAANQGHQEPRENNVQDNPVAAEATSGRTDNTEVRGGFTLILQMQ